VRGKQVSALNLLGWVKALEQRLHIDQSVPAETASGQSLARARFKSGVLRKISAETRSLDAIQERFCRR
jgi:hypothetical protein